MTHQFDLNKPAHHIANDVLRALEQIAHDSGIEIAFGVKSHNVIARLVQQYQDKLSEERGSSANTLRERMLKQEQDEIAQEAWLRERLKLLRFPDVEDVYVTDSYYFYVSFARLLKSDEIMLAGAANITIERTPPLRNRYRVVVNRLDKEEA